MTHSNGKPPVLSVGRLYCDLIFTDLPRLPTLGTEVFCDGFGAHAGGGAFITAAHLSQLGHSSFLAAMLPASPMADLMGSDIEKSRVDISLCAPLTPADGPQLTVAMVQKGDRSFLTRRAGAAFPLLSAEDIAEQKIRHLHVGEMTSLIEQPGIVDIARSQGATISVDCGWSDAFDARAVQRLLCSVDLFLPNEAEMNALLDLGVASNLAPVTAIKQGARGSTVVSKDGTLSVPAFASEVRDTTGAGDAFNAGFLSNWLSGASLQRCLEEGNRRGALAVRTTGGFAPEPSQISEIGVPGE